ncbi:amidohydrolase family protein [Maricaulaceae bacterium NA33B04]|nr:amidohydrolase family protein [Maricaulaceae bacterium NA33B04]
MTLLRNARLIDPASGRDELGDLKIRDGVIEAVGGSLISQGDEAVIDLEGAVLAPALIDLRCQVNPRSSGRSGLLATAQAAAAGGYGTLVIAPDAGLSSPESFAPIENAALSSPVNLIASGLLVDHDGEMGEIGLMLRAGAALLGDGGQPVSDTRLLKRALAYAATFEAWSSLRAEDPHLSRNTCAHEGDLSMRLGFAARPGAGERMAVDRATALAELTGARILLDRISTMDGLAALKMARSKGLEIAATVPVTHLIFNEVDTAGYDARYRLEPPLRSEADRDALIEALNSGQIDAIVSDHRACTGEAKAHPFPDAEPGAATLEAVLPALCTLVADERVELIEALRAVTSGPADLLGLPQGRLEIGAPADLVAFNPYAPNVYGRDGLSCDAPSAFENRRLVGKALITFANGAIINQPTG